LLSTENWTRFLFKYGGSLDLVRREVLLQKTNMTDLVEEYHSVWMREMIMDKGETGVVHAWTPQQLKTFARRLVYHECNIFNVTVRYDFFEKAGYARGCCFCWFVYTHLIPFTVISPVHPPSAGIREGFRGPGPVILPQ
jgi:hypothetical protein